MSFGPSPRPQATTTRAAGGDKARRTRQRVVILVDLDCFYAQCECVRLGFDALATPLVLMQWNSALAVTYPARDLGIKRGESWEGARQKSGGKCLAVHVPVIVRAAAAAQQQQQQENRLPPGATAESVAARPEGSVGSDQNQDAAEESFRSEEPEAGPSCDGGGAGAAGVDLDGAGMRGYDAMFRLSPDQQLAARERDLGVRYRSDQGKACIERYRVASARILETVSRFLSASDSAGAGGPRGVQVERASIDEFYMDVTEACAAAARSASQQKPLPEDWEQAIRETNVIGPQRAPGSDEDGDPGACESAELTSFDETNGDGSRFALQYGCWLAWKLRQEVRSKLGFTLSAGVAANKMLAKLSASYGKPNGQAVLYPERVSWLLDRTPIDKCRNLGGKLGAKVSKLLPPDAPQTVGSIARNVSLHLLTGDSGCGLGAETARWLLDYARGIDREAVQQETVVKTITSSKRLNSNPALSECSAWFELLVKEIVTRVERDAQAHHRYPRFYHVHYLVHDPSAEREVRQQSSKGWKASYPSYFLSAANKVRDILSTIIPTIAAREKSRSVRLQRIGLGAVEFLDRPAGGGGKSFFASKPAEPNGAGSKTVDAPDAAHSGNASVAALGEPVASVDSSCQGDSDAAMARRLQRAYDKMDNRLESFERSASRTGKCESGGSRAGGAARQDKDAQKPLLDRDSDVELAKRLQAEYDREERMVQALERRDKTEVQRASKTRKIDSFFRRAS
jgi:DNA polymerase eta